MVKKCLVVYCHTVHLIIIARTSSNYRETHHRVHISPLLPVDQTFSTQTLIQASTQKEALGEQLGLIERVLIPKERISEVEFTFAFPFLPH